jgi:hypothetical protein
MRSPGTFQSLIGTAQLFATTTAPQYLYGATVNTQRVALGSLTALISATASTSSLAITANWQVSDDASTWYDCATMNAAANVALVTGNGTGATVNRVLDAPSTFGWKYTRVKCTNSGANGDGANDGVTVSYRYIKA